MTIVTLVAGAAARQREAAIVAALQGAADPNASIALILEGLPDGTSSLDASHFPCLTHAVRLAPGCPCCIGNVVMRVTLNRILRYPPTRLYISLAAANHLAQVRHFLTQAPYHGLLRLSDDLLIQGMPASADK